MKTDRDSLVNLVFSLKWENDGISHHDTYHTENVNLWRDIFSEKLLEVLLNKSQGSRTIAHFRPGELVPRFMDSLVKPGNRNHISLERVPEGALRIGRFYPKGILKGIADIYRENVFPFRCVGCDGDQWVADLNHPLATFSIELEAMLVKIHDKRSERGGSCTDWVEILASGPGMQTRYHGNKTDFITDYSFEREDAEPDERFYARERLVSHVDDHAEKTICDIYGKVVEKGSMVLDLMASWDSHLPGLLELKEVHGLGLNEKELLANEKLFNYALQDINETPKLPFKDSSFNAVICSLSVEYITHPLKIFREVARVLKPGGVFALTFSNRSFPPKAIQLWHDLHEFERVGLVLEYFQESGLYDKLNTFSHRGFPRPSTDKYYSQFLYSDPVYGVWGSKI